ncbi:MAG TPA: ABC transporter ATP-binding protein [Myxococcaceae bacterium]|nr:ABC transporter ATP-binding protein [Myxococcaceae bacterium]
MEAAVRTIALRKVYLSSGSKRSAARAPPGGGASPGVPPSKWLGNGVVALESLDLEIGEGELFGLLGPNGAGKTTTIGILTTRVRPTSGTALVAGADVVKNDVGVRQRIGVVPQRPNPDRSLSVRENLIFHAAYFGIPTQVAAARARELLERLQIAEKSNAKPEQLSGGQQQRLMIARALIHNPSVLFLDEPTVGLDPQSRLGVWELLRALHKQGKTIVMSTHNLEEADRLGDRLAIIDRGKLLAVDTPQTLKARAPGGTLIELTLDGDAAPAADRARAVPGVSRVELQQAVLRAYSERGGEVIAGLIRAAEQSGRAVRNINLSPPSLETLFISLTGRKLD